MSGMFGTSAAQVGQRVSIIWLSLPFLFALVSAYFLPCLMRLGMLPDSDIAATISSGGCRGYAVESTCIAAVAFSFTRHRGRRFIQQAPQLQLWFCSAVDAVTSM